MDEAWPWPKVPAEEERLVRFVPAFHRCDPNPSKNYGIGSVKMLWVLRVGGWAIDWDVHTDWGLPDEAFKAAVPTCTHPRHQQGYPSHEAMGGAVDWHSPVPLYEGQERAQDECVVIGGGPCYLDARFLLGSELFDLLRIEGDEAVWHRLRELLDDRRVATSADAQIVTFDGGDDA